jgi:hypothetical protein
MNTLMHRSNPIPTLYVKTLAVQSFGPQWSLQIIFTKARQIAPCLLIFEDIDSAVTDSVRSYFFNELDGLESNEGILILGSTNDCISTLHSSSLHSSSLHSSFLHSSSLHSSPLHSLPNNLVDFMQLELTEDSGKTRRWSFKTTEPI